MKRKSNILHLVVGLACFWCIDAKASVGSQLFLSPDNFINTLVVADESVTQTMIISNAGNTDLEFSFCPPTGAENDGLVAHYPFTGNAKDE